MGGPYTACVPSLTLRQTRRARIIVLQSVAVSVVGVFPAFLVGALAVQLRADLHLGLASIGLATAFLFTVSSSLARLCGGLVQRIGSRWGAVSAASLATVSLVGAGLAGSYLMLGAALLVGGLANAVAQPSANLALSEVVSDRRLGFAFGIKQSSIPAATLLAGLAVPGIALTVGWRWVWLVAAVMALAVACWAALTPRGQSGPKVRSERSGKPTLPFRALLVLTVGGGLATASCTSLGVFLVDSGVHAGLSPGNSGLLYAACSLLGLLSRITLGWLADRYPARSLFVLIANLMFCGALGYILLSFGNIHTFVIGALLTYGAGWAWPGLFHYSIVKENRLAAASATGFVQTGLSFGAAIGPLCFGLLAGGVSYQVAWLAAAVLSLTAALTIRAGRRMVRRSRGLS